MHIRTIGLVAATTVLAAACGPQPGSAEWCKGVMEGKIEATQAQSEQHGQKCAMELMQEMMKSLQAPAQ
jgi:hypothetical protein